MNVDRMRAVANLIELEDRFYYGGWTRGIAPGDGGAMSCAARLGECGTTGCVAGWAAHLAWREGVAVGDTIYECAKTYLGLNHGEATRLFMGFHFGSDDLPWRDTSAVEVAKYMRAVADGETTL